MAAVRDPASDSAPPPAIRREVRSSLPADPSRATAALYRRHGATVYRYAWHMLGSREDAEDATQATFLSVHTALTSSTPVREPQAWVLKIARNECLARIAAGGRRPRSASLDDRRAAEVAAPAPSVPREVELRSDLQAARAALGRLPTSQRDAFVLREWLGLSTSEVASSLGTSVSAVDALLNRARRELIRVLGGADEAGAAGCVRTCESLADDSIDRATRAHLVRCRSCRAVRRALQPQLVVARSLIPSAALAGRLGDSLPGFAAGSSGGAVAGSAAVGGGGLVAEAVVAKLAAGPAALKGAAVVVASVAAVGGGVAIESAGIDGGAQPAQAAAVVVPTAPQKARADEPVEAATKPSRATSAGDVSRGDVGTPATGRSAAAAAGSPSGQKASFGGGGGDARPDLGSSGSGKHRSVDGHSGSGGNGDSGRHHGSDSGTGSGKHGRANGGGGSDSDHGDSSGSGKRGSDKEASGEDGSGKGASEDDASGKANGRGDDTGDDVQPAAA